MKPLHIASWSGPRNISTAMMRSWENRGDTYVCDEPLYAHYLLEHGHDHPGRREIVDHHESNAEKVITWLTGEIPNGHSIWYQKQMAHHLIDDVPRDWLKGVTNIFLIREPGEMITSLMQILPEPRLLDTGLPQQVEIFDRVRKTQSHVPPVIDARDVLLDPDRMLRLLCDRLGVQYSERMLSWPAGRRETDGVWAQHWYSAVERSTGFQPYKRKDIDVPEKLQPVLNEAQHLYDSLYSQRLH